MVIVKPDSSGYIYTRIEAELVFKQIGTAILVIASNCEKNYEKKSLN